MAIRNILTFVVLSASLNTLAVQASGYDGYALKKACNANYAVHAKGGVEKVTDKKLIANAVLCIAFIDGVKDGYLLAMVNNPDIEYFALCAPDTADRSKELSIFHEYLKNNPGQLGAPANVLFSAAMNEAFPCKSDTK